MDEKFVNKCFENWKAIVEYIEKQYENFPVSRHFVLDLVTKPNELTIMFELTVNTDGSVYLKSDDIEHYSDFANDFKLEDITNARCGYIRKKEAISAFCHAIETLCKDWDKIKEAITKSQEGYHAVMNFNVESEEPEKCNYFMELISNGNIINNHTIFCVTFNEAKFVAKVLLEDIQISHKNARINVYIEGNEELLFSLS